MRADFGENRSGIESKRMIRIAMAGILAGAITMASNAGAAGSGNSRVQESVINDRVIDRAEVENLQRWVSAGHAGWCKDARLVAAEELKRIAREYSGEGCELNAVAREEDSNGGNRMTFEWVPLDGRVLYRVTVERFEWLLPIAKNVESTVWVPTGTEIRIQK